ncbi:hypothetical protein [Enterococcus sp. JM9B]|uniref:hypothetical protein n=1 Tax=Enterococcus sp. JM9B TaxID=1857216 RepID=UPI001374BB24|nr:hypothetical protein [Enterococcus sp. JM9B]KAF1303115.1 hypothetical protein BAU16_05415 [Enterococcus sp. JM9B]
MARKMRMNSLINKNNQTQSALEEMGKINSGNTALKKLQEFNKANTKNADKDEVQEKDSNLQRPRYTTAEIVQKELSADLHKENTQNEAIQQSVSSVVTITSHERKGRVGRKPIYTDPLQKALEMQKISARTKAKLTNLIDKKFDTYTPDQMIDYLYHYYFEKGLSVEDQEFLLKEEEKLLQEYREKPKYQKLLQELKNN